MNLQYGPNLGPLRVLIVNSLSPASQLIAVKILSGEIFGKHQLIDVTLLVYSNEVPTAAGLKLELDRCAFSCTNSIKVSSDLPSVSDADVFCFITNFTNPNILDLESIEDDEQFDALYLVIKIADNLHGSVKTANTDESSEKNIKSIRKTPLSEKKLHKPIIIADGLVPIDILMSLSTNLPADIFFCPTPISAIAKTVLGEHLKVKCNSLNNVLVWAANDETFHVEFEKPLIVHDEVGDASPCDWNIVGKDMLATFNLDHTQFSETWIKKDLIEKTLAIAKKNPYGYIYKAAEIAKTLRDVWLTRINSKQKICTNTGVISDGSLETVKGYPYVLPITISGETWSISRQFEKDIHLKQEIKRINKTVKTNHQKLISFCKKFLVENVVNEAFIPMDDESVESEYYPGMVNESSRPSLTNKLLLLCC